MECSYRKSFKVYYLGCVVILVIMECSYRNNKRMERIKMVVILVIMECSYRYGWVLYHGELL